MPFRPSSVRTALALVVLAAPLALGAEPRAIAETDLFAFTWIADPQISPDGRRIAFVRVKVNEAKDGYDSAIWVTDADGGRDPRPFTSGPRDLSPRWSPDGRWLAFTRSVEKGGRPQDPQIHLMPADGGEARGLTDLPKGAGSPAWSPDSASLAFTSTTNARDLEAAARKGSASSEEAHESDVRVISRAAYRGNGRGYLDPTRPAHVWTVARVSPGEKPVPRQITTGDFEEQGPQWSPDGRQLYFVSDRSAEPYYDPPDSDLYAVPAAGGEMTRVASIDGTIDDYAPSPDGRRIAFEGTPRAAVARSFDQTELFVTELAGTPRVLTAAYDFDIGGGLTGDQRPPRGGLPASPLWSRDGRSVIVKSAERGRANLLRVDVATGHIDPLTSGDQEILAFTATPAGTRLALVLSTPTRIGDLFLLEAAAGGPRPLTHVNEALFSGLNVTAPEEIEYASFDGRKIQAWVQKPPDFAAGRKYPVILNIHGGPHAAYGYTFDHEFQWMAAKGYVVLYPNPRGSTSYGQEFANVIQFHYPGDDARDLMAGVDELVRRGIADEGKLGVTGGSGGGVLTNWLVTQTDRFKAAVSQRSIADWAGFWYTADFTLFRPTWFKAPPWEDPTDYVARSPISNVAKIKTPLMLIEGEADLRTPPADGGEQLFRALKYLKRPVVMVRFPEESHELSRSGKPWHRVERLRHIVAWFDKYLEGKVVEGY